MAGGANQCRPARPMSGEVGSYRKTQAAAGRHATDIRFYNPVIGTGKEAMFRASVGSVGSGSGAQWTSAPCPWPLLTHFSVTLTPVGWLLLHAHMALSTCPRGRVQSLQDPLSTWTVSHLIREHTALTILRSVGPSDLSLQTPCLLLWLSV